ncbi:MAG: HesA/MoeB/ThiF family protein [Candidatus Bathyarchaeota archaeon]|jgi:adenylyltransferase/sulfurtransferase|nr:HesA/MoeB/ThiF family protein [Candidatus Bathyarchaeota archaeon A05DMB-5]MDH7557670.1 HesA/MoeB/ThiF family protein [Candidatus Bathyarchaeota archaeon]
MPKIRKIPKFEEFYSRQIVLKEFGKKGQETLARSKVAVVGLGGLGTASSLYLALAGVGHLRLIDQDTVELHNLHRQVLYSVDDLSYPKVEVSAKRLKKINPLVNVEAVPENLNTSNVERLLYDVDCVVDGLDNMRTRYMINRACAKFKIPYVFGAAIGVEGNLSVFAPPETPCLECVFPSVSDEELLTCDVRGVLGATPGIIGTMQAMETIKVLAGMGSPLKSKFMICDFNDMYFTTIDIFKRDGCPACQGAITLGVKDKLVWLCGRETVNVNPEKPSKLNLNEVYEMVKQHFRVRVKSHFAIIFDYKNFEISLFNSGRMLIKNVKDEKSALEVYNEVNKKLGIS